MPVRNQNWYDLQASRRYPLDDRSTGIDDAGNLIDDSLLVDCHIRFPDTLGDSAFVQAITVSGTLVTVLIGATDETQPQASVTTIAAVNLPKPVQLNRNYNVTGLVPGVAGWIVFGTGIENEFTARYATPAQSRILPRCARAYRPLPIPTIGKANLATALTGVVELEAIAPVVATRKTLTVAGKQVDAIEFRLDGNITNVAYNPFEYFLGACGQRPESGTCPKQPIETINGVVPDCNGNITIVGDGITVYPFVPGGGIGIDIPLGLPDVCNKTRYEAPRQGVDECASSSTSGISSGSAISSSTAAGSSHQSSASAISSTSAISASLPFCQSFNAAPVAVAMIVSGRFASKTKYAPIKCLVGISSSSSALSSASSLSSTSSLSSASSSGPSPLVQANQLICASDDIFSTNLAILKNYPTDWAINKRITVEFKLAPGITNNAGLVFNYLPTAGPNNTPTYLVAAVDADRGTFMLLRYNGAAFVAEYTLSLPTAGFTFDATQWHKITVTPVTGSGSNVAVTCKLANSVESRQVSFSVVIGNYGAPIGASGIFADHAYAYFNQLTVE